MQRIRLFVSVLLAAMSVGCSASETAEPHVAGQVKDAPPGENRGLPCPATEQISVALDMPGPGQRTPAMAVEPFAQGLATEVEEGRGSVVAYSIGKDGQVHRVFSVTQRDDGWWPNGYIECQRSAAE